MHGLKCLRTSEICPTLFRVLMKLPSIYSIANACSSEAVVLALCFLITILMCLPSEQINRVPIPVLQSYEFGSHCLISHHSQTSIYF